MPPRPSGSSSWYRPMRSRFGAAAATARLYQSIARAPAVATWAAEEIPMINGAHAIVYSTDAEADRAFLRDVLGLDHVDAGQGWLIFGLPPAEIAIHPGEHNDAHEL